MNSLTVSMQDHVAVVGLKNGNTNAINAEFLVEFIELFENLDRDPAVYGSILFGHNSCFSTGFDLPALLEYTEAEFRIFWKNYLKLISLLSGFKKPLVAALNGHSIAGGCAIALSCDYRIMAEGDFLIGLNEMAIGLVVPPSVYAMYRFWLGEPKAYHTFIEGTLFSPNQALEIGLVDQVVSERALRSVVEKKMQSLLQKDPVIWQQNKATIKRQQNVQDEEWLNQQQEAVVEHWFSPSNQSIMKTIVENLKARN